MTWGEGGGQGGNLRVFTMNNAFAVLLFVSRFCSFYRKAAEVSFQYSQPLLMVIVHVRVFDMKKLSQPSLLTVNRRNMIMTVHLTWTLCWRWTWRRCGSRSYNGRRNGIKLTNKKTEWRLFIEMLTGNFTIHLGISYWVLTLWCFL